jgi:hypothetical protein
VPQLPGRAEHRQQLQQQQAAGQWLRVPVENRLAASEARHNNAVAQRSRVMLERQRWKSQAWEHREEATKLLLLGALHKSGQRFGCRFQSSVGYEFNGPVSALREFECTHVNTSVCFGRGVQLLETSEFTGYCDA